MSRLRWEAMPPAPMAQPGDRMWGATRGPFSFIKSYTDGYGWCVSFRDRSQLLPVTLHHNQNPFDSEAEADAAVDRLLRRVEN